MSDWLLLLILCVHSSQVSYLFVATFTLIVLLPYRTLDRFSSRWRGRRRSRKRMK